MWLWARAGACHARARGGLAPSYVQSCRGCAASDQRSRRRTHWQRSVPSRPQAATHLSGRCRLYSCPDGVRATWSVAGTPADGHTLSAGVSRRHPWAPRPCGRVAPCHGVLRSATTVAATTRVWSRTPPLVEVSAIMTRPLVRPPTAACGGSGRGQRRCREPSLL